MSKTHETCIDIKIPPGSKIVGGKNKINWKKVNGNEITFLEERPSTPLPPLVQTTFYPLGNESNNGTLEVCAFVYIAAELSEKSPISVYYQNVEPTPNFYITYDAPEIKSAVFTQYQVTFAIGMDKKPNLINTIVWDEDPKASRGTLTTVQP